MRSHARLNTDRAAHYLAGLARDWSGDPAVGSSQASVRIPLPVGACVMLAEPDGLNLTVEAPDMASLVRLEDVVAEGLKRLTAGEPPRRLAWTRAWEAGRIDPPALRINRLRP